MRITIIQVVFLGILLTFGSNARMIHNQDSHVSAMHLVPLTLHEAEADLTKIQK